MLKKDINTESVINQLRLERDDIAWIGIDIEGTNVVVNIVKADESPEVIDSSEYCNIVASKPGVITKIIAQNGTAVVQVGDTVNAGDILIAGYMEGKYSDTRYVHSLGEVEARVMYKQTKEIQFNQEIHLETGETESITYSLEEAVNIGEKELNSEIEEKIETTDNIVVQNIDTEEKENSVILTITYEVTENIGVTQKIK